MFVNVGAIDMTEARLFGIAMRDFQEGVYLMHFPLVTTFNVIIRSSLNQLEGNEPV